MRIFTAALAATLLAALPLIGQESPNRPKFVKSVKAPGLEVRYLDFRWDAEAFNALEKGGAHFDTSTCGRFSST